MVGNLRLRRKNCRVLVSYDMKAIIQLYNNKNFLFDKILHKVGRVVITFTFLLV